MNNTLSKSNGELMEQNVFEMQINVCCLPN